MGGCESRVSDAIGLDMDIEHAIQDEEEMDEEFEEEMDQEEEEEEKYGKGNAK